MEMSSDHDNNKRDTYSRKNGVFVENPWLPTDSPDVLYHLGLSTKTHDLQKMFGDVKFVCMGGTSSRMHQLAKMFASELGVTSQKGEELRDLTGHVGRYSTFKVGPVLAMSHGIGGPSLSILMHETIKLLYHAKCTDVTFFRTGTCGGLGIRPGTVVISESAIDELLNPKVQVCSLGRVVERSCVFDSKLNEDLRQVGQTMAFPVISGITLSTNDFYEGQGRLDGAFCDYSPEQKMSFLRKLQSLDVKNIEMEAQMFGTLLRRARVKGAAVCVTLVDRLHGDQIDISPEDYLSWQERPQQLILEYIRNHLAEP